jgi:hypothetical protein
LSAHCGKKGIVEFLRPGNIVAADHDVAEHFIFSFMSTFARSRASARKRKGARGPDSMTGRRSAEEQNLSHSSVTARRSGKGGGAVRFGDILRVRWSPD